WETRGTTTEPQDRHYPHGMFELLVNLMGNRYRLLQPRGAGTFTTTWLVGQQLGPIVTAPPDRHHVLGIRLRPAGAYALLAAALREQIGVTPKVYARLVRFRLALAMLESGVAPLADVALAAGYYDQPHFNAEFRDFTGQSPRELLVARYPSGVPIVRTDE